MTDSEQQPLIGFIGQGFIGKHMADDFEERGYEIVRYTLEEPYNANKDAVATCDIVFIAVPTPTTPDGFSDDALRAVLPLVGEGKIAVIKSTILPGRTEELQKAFPHCKVLHAPEFLREKQAALDTKEPRRNIVGIPEQSDEYVQAGELVLSVLPEAPYQKLCTSREAELVKYGGNCFLATKVVFMNMLYDLAAENGADYETVAEAMTADERIGTSHMKVVDNSGHDGAIAGRGAGGHCFPKDIAALREYTETLGDHAKHHAAMLRAIEETNLQLLTDSQKDLDLLQNIYGEERIQADITANGTHDVILRDRKPTLGFIGQGFVGNNIANDFEQRGFTVTRYALDEPYIQNKNRIKDADIVFVAVPTPTTPLGFDSTILESVIPLVGRGKTVVIKSTVLPGTTELLQNKFSDKILLFSPEFLLMATAAHDAAFPIMNVVGIPKSSSIHRKQAQLVLSILPESPHDQICSTREAEIFKYIHNIHGVWRILFTNVVYDLAQAHGATWEVLRKAMEADPYMNSQASYYNQPLHKSGRGAGGHCFIKDFAAFREGYEKICTEDNAGITVLRALENKNYSLLLESGKDLDLLANIYGEEPPSGNVRPDVAKV